MGKQSWGLKRELKQVPTQDLFFIFSFVLCGGFVVVNVLSCFPLGYFVKLFESQKTSFPSGVSWNYQRPKMFTFQKTFFPSGVSWKLSRSKNISPLGVFVARCVILTKASREAFFWRVGRSFFPLPFYEILLRLRVEPRRTGTSLPQSSVLFRRNRVLLCSFGWQKFSSPPWKPLPSRFCVK